MCLMHGIFGRSIPATAMLRYFQEHGLDLSGSTAKPTQRPVHGKVGKRWRRQTLSVMTFVSDRDTLIKISHIYEMPYSSAASCGVHFKSTLPLHNRWASRVYGFVWEKKSSVEQHSMRSVNCEANWANETRYHCISGNRWVGELVASAGDTISFHCIDPNEQTHTHTHESIASKMPQINVPLQRRALSPHGQACRSRRCNNNRKPETVN